MDGTDLGKVREYYAQGKEWARLETPAGRLEFLRTMDLIERHLAAESRVLDLGGGPGRYTIALAGAGHRVWMGDLSAELLETARQKIEEHGVSGQVESTDEVNATDLSIYDDASFDAVLALGPFYHLRLEEEAEAAAREIHRVLARDGTLFAAFVPRLSCLAGLISRAGGRPDQVSSANYEALWRTGTFRNRTKGGFQEGSCPTIGEVRSLFERAGFSTLSIQSLKGIAHSSAEALFEVERTDPELFTTIMRSIEETSTDESVIDMGEHAMYIGRK